MLLLAKVALLAPGARCLNAAVAALNELFQDPADWPDPEKTSGARCSKGLRGSLSGAFAKSYFPQLYRKEAARQRLLRGIFFFKSSWIWGTLKRPLALLQRLLRGTFAKDFLDFWGT